MRREPEAVKTAVGAEGEKLAAADFAAMDYAARRRPSLGQSEAQEVVVSVAGLVASLLIVFSLLELVRPLIGPTADDSMKERFVVAAAYAVWFALAALVSWIAWRRLLSKPR